jgi:hypothetical protein
VEPEPEQPDQPENKSEDVGPKYHGPDWKEEADSPADDREPSPRTERDAGGAGPR